jgi:hypothetical protein
MDSVPNLDGMSANELRDGSPSPLPCCRRAVRRCLSCDRQETQRPFAARGGTYARSLRGDITAAQIYEKICDDIYDRLPADLRW